MIKLSKNDGTPIASLENDQDFYLYLTQREDEKLFKNHPEFGKSFWSFSIYSPRQLGILIQNAKKRYDIKIMEEALAKYSCLIEICEGDYNTLTQIIVTPDVDVTGLRNNWCLAYCKEHKIVIE